MTGSSNEEDELPIPSKSLGIRKHLVNLERVQRIFEGIDAKPMAFDEETVASMIQSVADECDEHSAFILHAVVRALRGQDDHHKLILKQKRPGKWESPTRERARHRQHLAWIIRLNRMKARGWPTEAAIHQIARTTGVSVSKVYAGIADEGKWQKEMNELAAEIAADMRREPK